MRVTPELSVADYDRAFDLERMVEYPPVDLFEVRQGHKLFRSKLEDAARILACPVKIHAPNWQHGRILYALTARYVAEHYGETFRFLDIGTAKGFSALCLAWALKSSQGDVYSVDVIDPNASVRRNTVEELAGFKTLYETLAPWTESAGIHFEQSTGIDWLMRHPERIHVAFVDGKHSGDVVVKEGKLLADRQRPGDLVMFDDVQIPGVALALKSLDCYALEYLSIKPERTYAIGVRR